MDSHHFCYIRVRLLSCGAADANAVCKNPTIASTTYSTSDGNLATRTAFAAQFTIACNGQQVKVGSHATWAPQ